MPIGAGDVLDDRFEIQRVAASGGMGVIFRGVDHQTGDLVGVKAMRAAGDATRFQWLGGDDEVRQAADQASRRALELGPKLSESHVARGAVLAMRGDYPAAEPEYEEAIRLNRNSFEARIERQLELEPTTRTGR
jgi:serine/threonine protein kinase